MTQELAAATADLAALRGPSPAAVAALSQLKNEPDWLRRRRLAAWDIYAATEPPKWHYIDSHRFKLADLAPYAAAPDWAAAADLLPADARALADNGRTSAGFAIQVNSDLVRHGLDPELAAQGVILTSMEEAVVDHPALVQEHFLLGGGIAMADDHFVALHAALWSGGLFLYVPKDVEIDLPVYFYHTVAQADAMTQPHNLVIVDRHAKLNLYEESFAQTVTGSAYAGANTFLHLKDGSQARVVVVQRWGHNMSAVSKHQVFVGRDARINITTALVGGGLVQNRVRAELQGTGANSEMHAMILAANRQHLDLIAENRHQNANTHGDMIVKQVLKDRSRTGFQGLIRIDRAAPQSTDYLAADALVLDEGAVADAIPGLEIFNDDVQASHGATVGEIDKHQLFYMMSRGVSRADAELMIVAGFFEPLLRRIPEESLRTRLAGFINDKIARKA